MDNFKDLLSKKLINSCIIGGGSFILGFFAFYAFNRKKNLEPDQSKVPKLERFLFKNIPVETLEKILSKVKDKFILMMAAYFDKCSTFINSIYLNSDIVIDTISTGEQARINVDNQVPKLSKNQEFRKHLESKFMVDNFTKMEADIVNSFQFKIEDYIKSLKENSLNDKIKKLVNFISKFKEEAINGELMILQFDENLKNNYIKIVSNIYYLNIMKIQLTLQREYLDKNHVFYDHEDAYKKIQEIYNQKLKITRKEVIEFFNIKGNEDLSIKIILRLYYYYLPKNDESRLKMDLINVQVNYIIDRLSHGYKFSLFFAENDPKLVKNPTDAILDFGDIIKSLEENKGMNYESAKFLQEKNQVGESTGSHYLRQIAIKNGIIINHMKSLQNNNSPKSDSLNEQSIDLN